MNKNIYLTLGVLPLLLVSCATPPPPRVFHNTDSTALVIKSLDRTTSQMLQPATTVLAANDQTMDKAKSLPQHQTAVVMLENYTEPKLGDQYRERGTPLFINLRALGYEHIVFVQGQNVSDPNGLITLAEYH
jgi:hypothetical protein